MKRVTCRFSYYSLVLGVFSCLLVILTSPLMSNGASSDTKGKNDMSDVERIEARIEKFHSELKITAEQEERWNKVAQVMRENESKMHALVQAREERGSTLSAVENLKSYSEIADEHAASLKKFIPVFEDLYSTMSESQKKMADGLFFKRMSKTRKEADKE